MKLPYMSSRKLYRWTHDLHLYSGLFISPFIIVYAMSTILFNHAWKPWGMREPEIHEEETSINVSENVEGLTLAKQIMRQLDVSGEIEFLHHNPQQRKLVIPVVKPGRRVTINVDLGKGIAQVERQHTGFWDRLLYLHKSPGPHLAGFRGNWFYIRIWRWLADMTVYLTLFISASGIYIWYVSRAERRIGLILLGAGCFTFFLIIFAMVG